MSEASGLTSVVLFPLAASTFTYTQKGDLDISTALWNVRLEQLYWPVICLFTFG
jgi:hypothetical protein